MIKAVFFDLDGVVVDSEFLNVKAAIMSFKDACIDLAEEDKQIIVGRHPADYYDIFLRKYKFDSKKMKERHLANYYNNYHEVYIFKDTQRLIIHLKDLKMPLALVTSSPRKSVDLKVNGRFDFAKIFDVIITFDDCSTRKPFPDAYLMAAEKLSVKPANCLVFEDTAIGVEAAKNAGMKCIALPNGYTKNQDFKKADLIISHNEINWEDISAKILC